MSISEQSVSVPDASAMVARLLAISADAIITVDEAQRIIQFNHGAEDIFGWSTEEIIGRPLDILLPERARAVHARHIIGFGHAPEVARRMGERREIFGLRKSGEEFPAEASIAKLDVGDRHVYSVVLRDVTERKRVEAELRSATQAREAILGVVAHDLRSPLSGIALCTRALLADPEADAPTRGEFLAAIDQAVGWMDRMIADLLDVSQIESGHLTLEPVLLDMAVVLAEGIAMQQGRAADREVMLSADISPALPFVQADPDRLLQVLSNLLGNAIKFTPSGGQVSLYAHALDGTVVVTVDDTGPGIPAEQLPHIFAPYWQRRRVGTPRGTGLGLAIVTGIIEAHGGHVWVDSIEGEGSRFSFSLPIHDNALPHVV